MCDIAPDNLIYFKLLGFFFLAFVIITHLKGVAVFRTSLTRRSEDPLQYWIMQIAYFLFSGWLLYPVYFC
ncbi:MAG: hypothetical protein ACI9KN_001573 [Gammaproteobacteria bacterium]|jgi:hypothetical protein